MYLFCDTETTGLDPQKHGIIQIACLWVANNGDEYERFHSRVRLADGLSVDGGALAINKRRHAELLDAPTEAEVCEKIRQKNGRREWFFAGYNCAFDQRMVWAMMQRTGIFTKYMVKKTGPMDVLKLAREVLRKPEDVENHKLVTVAKYFGCLRENAHDAMEDILMTRDVWLKCVRKQQQIKAGY